MMRIVLFLATNAAIMVLISVVFQALGIEGILAENGVDLNLLDRFHVMQKFNQRLNEVRAEEAKQLKSDGYEPVLKNSRWWTILELTLGRDDLATEMDVPECRVQAA